MNQLNETTQSWKTETNNWKIIPKSAIVGETLQRENLLSACSVFLPDFGGLILPIGQAAVRLRHNRAWQSVNRQRPPKGYNPQQTKSPLIQVPSQKEALQLIHEGRNENLDWCMIWSH